MSHENSNWNFYNSYQNDIEWKTTINQVDDIIAMYGIDVWYLQKTTSNLDKFFGEDPTTIFESAVKLTVLANLDNWISGDAIFSKFGLESNFANELYISLQNWTLRTGTNKPNIDDLFYIPNFGKWFQISSDNSREPYYLHGKPMLWNIPVVSYIHSHESIITGEDDVDDNIPDTEQFVNDENVIIDSIEKEEDLLTGFDDLNKLFEN